MKITAIKQQVKNPERASFFVDGKYSFSLGLNELIVEKLKIGQELDEADIKRLKKLSEDGKLKNRALEWVLNRPRSEKELKDYLFRKKADPDQTGALVEEFKTRNYLNDTNFSRWLIDMRRRKGKSERIIKNELMKKGVSREVIAEVLEETNTGELERLKTLVAKKGQLSRYKNDEVKFKQFLLRQGFNYDDIKSVLSNTEHGSDR